MDRDKQRRDVGTVDNGWIISGSDLCIGDKWNNLYILVTYLFKVATAAC